MTYADTFRSSVTRRVVALFVTCALLPVAATLLLSYGRVHDALIEHRAGQLRGAVSSYATTLVDRLAAAESVARSVAADARSERLPQEWGKGVGEFFRSGVAFGPGGARVLFGNPAHVPAPREFGVLEPRLAAGSTALAVLRSAGAPASAWLVSDAGGPPGELRRLALELTPRYLWGSEDDAPYLTDLCVLAPDGALLNCTRPLPQAALAALRARWTAKSIGDLTWEAGTERHLSSYRELFLRGRFGADTWLVVASQPEAYALAPVQAVAELVVPLVALGLLVAGLLGMVQVRRTLRPLKELIGATARIGSRDFTARVPAQRDDEFGTLGRALNSMSARLGRQFNTLLAQAEIDAVILSNVDLPRIAAIVLRHLADLVPADRCLLLLAEPGPGERYRVHSADGADELAGRSVVIAGPDAERLVAASGGLPAGGGARTGIAGLAGIGARGAFALPIALGAQLAGAIVLGYDDDRLPDAEEIQLLRELGGRVAVALATARRDQELHRRAYYDSLTQLPNRLLGIEELKRALAAAAREQRPLAVLFVDLDGFATVNDSFGHSSGDLLLIEAAARLRRTVRQSDIVARLGGDEFAVVLAELRDVADAAVAARHAVEALAAPFELATGTAFVSASVGVALYPSDGATAEELLRHADLAMYEAKGAGRGQIAFFEASMNAEVQRRVELDRDLRLAIEQEQFELHYQPQLDLRSDRIIGAEALIRWHHPARGMVPPLQFIGFAESSGLIERIGRWALHAACARFVAWRAAGLPIEYVSVNVSPRQFQNPEFAQIVAEVLQESAMPPSALHLEITESAVIDSDGAAEANLGALSKLGTPIELDDFGTGYSSLAYLQRLPVAVVKLDRAFIRPIEASPSARAVVRAAIDMAHALGKSVVAEGVEEAGQLALLAAMGCDTMQGYHLSAALPAAEFEQLVREHSAAHASPAERVTP